MCNLFPRTDRKVKWHLLPNCSAGKIKDLVHSQAQKLLNSTLINSWPLKGCITSVRWGEAQINTQVIYMVRQRSTLLCRRQQQEFLILLLVSQLQKDLLWKILAKNTKNTNSHSSLNLALLPRSLQAAVKTNPLLAKCTHPKTQ